MAIGRPDGTRRCRIHHVHVAGRRSASVAPSWYPREIARRSESPLKEADDWCLSAAKLIHARQIAGKRYGDALKTVQYIEKLTGRLKEERQPPRGTTLLVDPAHKRQDLQMIGRAVRNNWDIPAHVLESLPAEVAEIIGTAKDPRTRIAAAKVLVAMFGQNQKAKPVTQRVKHTHTLKQTPVTDDMDERRSSLLKRLGENGEDA